MTPQNLVQAVKNLNGTECSLIGDAVYANLTPLHGGELPSENDVLAEVAALEAAQGAVAYRKTRAARYMAELSPEGGFQMTVGDMIDALVKEVRDLRSVIAILDPANAAANLEFKIKTDIIDAIKSEVPKP
jgi:hypothetical protein